MYPYAYNLMSGLLQKQRNGTGREARGNVGRGVEGEREGAQGGRTHMEGQDYHAERLRKWQRQDYSPHLPQGEPISKQAALIRGGMALQDVEMLSENPSSQIVPEQLGQSCHAMILSQINNPPRYDHLALLRIRNATSELRHTQLELADVVQEQGQIMGQFVESAREEWEYMLRRFREEIGKGSAREIMAQEKREELIAQNEALQEHIFDMEQRMVGVELQVERRVKQRGRQAEKQAAAMAREECQEIILQLQAELAAMRQKAKMVQSSALPAQIREREYELSQRQSSLLRIEEELREESARLQSRKQALSQREHQLLSGEQNLARKISQFRKKQAELSEWQAQLTRKTRLAKPAQDHSRVQLSRQASLKSFGMVQNRDELMIAPTSLEQLGARRRPVTLNNEEEPQSPRADPLSYIRQRRQARPNAQNSTILPLRDDVEGRRYNLQHSGVQHSREASPYRALIDPKARDRENSRSRYAPVVARRQALLLHPSREQRLPYKPSPKISSSQVHSRKNSESSGLGSKLERLREQIKKQIESIK